MPPLSMILLICRRTPTWVKRAATAAGYRSAGPKTDERRKRRIEDLAGRRVVGPGPVGRRRADGGQREGLRRAKARGQRAMVGGHDPERGLVVDPAHAR